MDSTKFDVVTIGGGPGATPAAEYLARRGKRVAVVEQGPGLGGTCLFEGCIPSKIYLETARRIRDIHEDVRFGLPDAHFSQVALASLTERKQKILRQRTGEAKKTFAALGIAVLHGQADFVDPHRVIVQSDEAPDRVLTADYIIASPGSKPRPLHVPEADDASLWTNAHALKLDAIPSSLCIVGGGYIGVELATLYHTLGTHVHILESAPRLLISEDPAVAAYLENAWSRESDPVTVETGVRVTRIDTTGSGRWAVGYNHPQHGFSRLVVDRVLVAIGREPNTQHLSWDKAGITLGPRGEVPVNRYQQTATPHIYAPGDVNGQVMLAHAATRQSQIAAQHILKIPAFTEDMTVPHVIFSFPEISAVGADTRDLPDRPDWRVTVWPYANSARPLIMGDGGGFAQIIWSAATHEVKGCQIIGQGAGELIDEITHVITHHDTLESLVAAIHPHPTLSEVVGELGASALAQAEAERPSASRNEIGTD